MHPPMPPKLASAVQAAPRRSHAKSADKSTANSSCSTPTSSASIPPSTNIILANLDPSQKDLPVSLAVAGKNSEPPPCHAAPLSSPKARVTDPGLEEPGTDKSVGLDLEISGSIQARPVTGAGGKKKKIVKKIVKVVKKVIVKRKRRVPVGDSVKGLDQNRGSLEKSGKSNDDSEKRSNLSNDVVSKTSLFGTGVNVGSQIVDEVEEKSSLVDGVAAKASLVNEELILPFAQNVGTRVTREKDNAKDVNILNDVRKPVSVGGENNNSVEIRGNMCDASPVEGNDTIYLGLIDRNWRHADVVRLLEKAEIEKMNRVVVKADPIETGKNRGFAFVGFKTSTDAQIGFRKLCKEIEAEKLAIKVEWAQPFKPSKQMKHVFNHSATQATMNPNESRNKRKRAFTTDRSVPSFGQHPTTIGPSFPDHRFPLPGTEPPFSFMGRDPRYMEPTLLPPLHFGASHPMLGGPSAPFNGFNAPPFPYYHQQRPDFGTGWNVYPSHFQTNELAAAAAARRYRDYRSYPTN